MHRLAKCISILFIAFISTELNAQDTCTVDEYLEDLAKLKSWVENVNPDPFKRVEKEVWDSVFVASSSLVDSTTNYFEFCTLAGNLLATIEDSHTLLSLKDFQTKYDEEFGILKLKFKYLDGGIYVFNDPKEFITPGTQIDKINGVPILDLFSSALSLSTIEGKSYTSKIRVAETLLNLVILNSCGNESESVRIKNVNGDEIDYLIDEFVEKTKKKKKKSEKDCGVEWVWPEEGETPIVFLKIKSFNEGEYRAYYKELNKGFKQLNRSGHSHLVVDLRGNLGGEASRVETLIKFIYKDEIRYPYSVILKMSEEAQSDLSNVYKGLTKWVVKKFSHKDEDLEHFRRLANLEIGGIDTLYFSPEESYMKHIFEGEICLLMDGLSASGSVSFASKFKSLNRGYIIGEPCMGSMTGTYANPILRSLPNSGVSVNLSSGIFFLDSTMQIGSTPIRPNRFIQWSANDMANGIDPHIEAVEDWYSNPQIGNHYGFMNRESKILFSELETVYSSKRSYDGSVREKVFNHVVKCDSCINEYIRKIKDVERLDAIEDEILNKVLELQGLKKSCSELRNAMIKLDLPLDLQATFDELIAPNRPAVLHFGIHNRADCNVCKK